MIHSMLDNDSMYFVVMFAFAGTRFRPLSFNVPKPLFPLAGQPMVHHPISACKKVYTISLHVFIYNLPSN